MSDTITWYSWYGSNINSAPYTAIVYSIGAQNTHTRAATFRMILLYLRTSRILNP